MGRQRSLSIASALAAVVLALVSANAFRQVPDNLWDPEPGSVLFGVLHLVIGTAAAVGAGGLLRRARWAAGAIGGSGAAAVALLVAQPLYDPMPMDALRSLGVGIGVIGAVTAALAWCAWRVSASARPERTSARDTSPAQSAIAVSGPAERVAPMARDESRERLRE